MNIYWGDLHNHCGITYGFGSLEHAIERAKSQLDYCAFTGHAMWPDMYEKRPETEFVVNFHEVGFKKLNDHWPEIREKVKKAGQEGLVTFQGYELHSSQYGDHHLLSPEDDLPLVYGRSPEDLIKACGKDAIVIPHHIGYPAGYRGINWDAFDSSISPVVEVYSKHGCGMCEEADYPYYHNMGPRDGRNLIYEGLKRGKQFSFVASTDHHAGFPGSYGDGMAAVWAEEKSRENIWKAIKAGRTYAVTGDRIRCSFDINGVPMGAKTYGNRRKIHWSVETEYALDKIVIYKNQVPIYVENGETYREIPDKGRYKLRVEMGWGKQNLYRWNGRIQVTGGKIIALNPYFRGRSVLAPSQDESYDADSINDIATYTSVIDEDRAEWTCDTVGNKSTLHPSTSSLVFEIQGDLNTIVYFKINHKEYKASIKDLLEYGYVTEMEYYHSQAFKIHPALPCTRYQFEGEIEDNVPQLSWDVYHMEVCQKNRQWAYVSPVYVKNNE